ncbi:MAG: Uma2 family endonuclease [Gemmatales bacterium]|nr:Uma2 family endonuclease [Gemmatales bacterium]MDW7994296.1 Uma2 family endonuclease [Gemmatales bacterium]
MTKTSKSQQRLRLVGRVRDSRARLKNTSTLSNPADLRDGQRLTLAEYLAGPEDDRFMELIDGVLYMSPAPASWHQSFEGRLFTLLDRWVSYHVLGWVWFDVDMVLAEEPPVVYRPDIVFLAQQHAERHRDYRIYGPADLCVEILSPSDRPSVVLKKHEHYARFGVPWYWEITGGPSGPWRIVEYQLSARRQYRVQQEKTGQEWFEPGIFPGLVFRLDKLAAGEFKAAVKGKAKRLV